MAGPVPRPICESVDVRGETPTHLPVASGHLLTANYGSGSVTVLPLAAAGTPQAVGDVLRHEGRGPDSARPVGWARTRTKCFPTPQDAGCSASTSAPGRPATRGYRALIRPGAVRITPVVRRGPAGSRRRGRFRWPGAGGRAFLLAAAMTRVCSSRAFVARTDGSAGADRKPAAASRGQAEERRLVPPPLPFSGIRLSR
ncbi:beta-propeller fold lactonase family protein [Streptomyces zaomyceticus]